MAERVSWSMKVAIGGGPSLADAQTIEIEAYDKIVVEVPGGEEAEPGTVTVEVQPSATVARIKVMAITSNRYGEALTYSVNKSASKVPLDAPQLLLGAGAVGLLGAAPETLSFSNGLGANQPATVTILVGRRAVSP